MRRAYVEADKCVSDHGCVTSILKLKGKKYRPGKPHQDMKPAPMQRKMTRNESKAGIGNEIEGTRKTTRRK